MPQGINRRKFLKNSVSASMAIGLSSPLTSFSENTLFKGEKVKIGIIGTGGRGTGLMRLLLGIEDVELSGISIQKNNPVPFPDFTKDAWKNRMSYFALDNIQPGTTSYPP